MAKGLDSQWPGIPFEIIEQIIPSCDNSTLLALAQTNRQLNHQAIRALLLRQSSTSNHPKGFRFDSPSSSHTFLVPAFNLAFSEFHAPDFAYCFYATPNLFREALSVIRFLDFISIDKSITLSFDQVHGVTGHWWMDATSAKVWKVIIIRLLKTALGKGCCHLTLYSDSKFLVYTPRARNFGSIPNAVKFRSSSSRDTPAPATGAPPPCRPISFVLPHPHPPLRPLRRVSHFRPVLHTIYQEFTKWFQDRVRPNRFAVPRTGPSSSSGIRRLLPCPLRSSSLASTTDSRTLTMSSPSLTRLGLESAMMLHPFLIQNTVDLIQENIGSLRYLVLDYHLNPTHTCKELLKTISLPKLESFTFKVFGKSAGYETLPGIILEFLTRHPTVRELEVEGIHPVAHYPEFDSTNLLPNLESLEATPHTLSWLLQNPIAYPKLKQISRTYDCCFNHIKNGLYAIFDIGMVPLSQLIDSTTSTRPINVRFRFSTESGSLTSMVLNGPYIATLPPWEVFESVKNMTVLVHYDKRFVGNFKELLPALQTFPNLKRLEFCEVENTEDLKKIKLIEMVQRSCRLIEEVKIREENEEV